MVLALSLVTIEATDTAISVLDPPLRRYLETYRQGPGPFHRPPMMMTTMMMVLTMTLVLVVVVLMVLMAMMMVHLIEWS